MTQTMMDRSQLRTLPRKSLLKICDKLEIEDMDGQENSILIDAIIDAMQSESAEESKPIPVKKEPEPKPKPTRTRRKAKTKARSELAKDHGKKLVDIDQLTIADLQTMRPDLVQQSRQLKPKGNDIDETGPKAIYQVSLGFIGPVNIPANSEADALQVFMERTGCTGYNKIKPKVTLIKPVK